MNPNIINTQVMLGKCNDELNIALEGASEFDRNIIVQAQEKIAQAHGILTKTWETPPKLLFGCHLVNSGKGKDGLPETWLYLSEGTTDAQRLKMVEKAKARGDNAFVFYASNDGALSCRHNPSLWADVSPEDTRIIYRKDHFIHWIHHLRANGLEPFPVLMHNGPQIWFNRDSKGAVQNWFRTFINEVAKYDNLVKYIVLACEPEDYWNEQTIEEHLAFLKKNFSWYVVAHNAKSLPNWLHSTNIDIIGYQTGFQDQNFYTTILNVVNKYNKPVIAFEFAMYGESEDARAKAKSCLAAGAIGALTGYPTMIPQFTREDPKYSSTPVNYSPSGLSCKDFSRIFDVAESIKLNKVSVAGDIITFDWEGLLKIIHVFSFDTVGNLVYIQDGVARTADWIRPGQKTKNFYDTLKNATCNLNEGLLGVMVTSPIRAGTYKLTEIKRSNILWIRYKKV